MKVTNGGTKTTTFTYGDTITVSGTIKASGTAPQANTLAAPGKNQAALFLGGTQLTDPVAVAGNGSFTISYKTSEKGIQTTGQAQILTVKYGGSDDLNEGSAACSITLNPKKVQAEVDGAITKPFDQTAKAHVTLKLAEGALSVEQKTIALLYGEAVLDTETVSEYGGTYYLTYETAGQKIPTGNSIQLQVVYGGNGNLKESTANVSVTLNPKPVTAVVENEITKFYDGEKNAAVTLAFGEGAILTGDEVNVSAPNAAYTTAEAGTGIAINFGSLTVTGKDAG